MEALGKVNSVKKVQSVSESRSTSYTDALISVSKINKIEPIQKTKLVRTPINEIYTNHYVLDISPIGQEYLKLFKDDVPLVNKNVFSYTRDLRLVYKDSV